MWNASCAAWLCANDVQIKLPPVAKDFIQKLLCNVEDRLGTRSGAAQVKVCCYLLWDIQ